MRCHRQPRRRAPVDTQIRSATSKWWEAPAPSVQTVRIAGPSPHSGHHAPPDPSPGCATSNRHSAVAFDPRCGTGRGFLPRGLSDTCPHADVRRRIAACAGRRPTTLNRSGPSRTSALRRSEVETNARRERRDAHAQRRRGDGIRAAPSSRTCRSAGPAAPAFRRRTSPRASIWRRRHDLIQRRQEQRDPTRAADAVAPSIRCSARRRGSST